MKGNLNAHAINVSVQGFMIFKQSRSTSTSMVLCMTTLLELITGNP